MMKLIGSLGSPYVRKARIVLAEKKIDYKLELENVWAPETDIHASNPLGKVPCLVMGLGRTLGGNVLDPALIDRTVDGTPASGGKPAVPGWAQDFKPDRAALDGANGKPGLIAQVRSAYDTWQGAQATAAANPNDGGAQNAARAALTQYHAAMSAALDAAAGRAPGDSSWQSDPVYGDTMTKARTQLELTALAPQIQAAQAAGQGSPAYDALDTGLRQWEDGLDALQIIGRVRSAGQSATPPGADPSAGNVAAAQALTAETSGLQQADPGLYRQVMDDAFVGNLGKTALASITGAAALPWVCSTDEGAIANATARFHAAASLLQQYQPTVIYAQLMDDVAGDPVTQQLFSTIGNEVQSRPSDSDKLKLLADVTQGSGSADLSAQLVHQMFGTGGAKPGFSPAQLVAWTRNANDLTQVSRIYGAAGGAQNQDMADLRHALETMVTRSDPSFGGESDHSRLNAQHRVIGRGGSVTWGEDLGFGNLKKRHQPMQLAQDMLGDNAADPLGKEIARETGFKDAGQPAAGVSASAPGNAAYLPGASVAVSAGGRLVGLPLPDGMQTLSSDDALLNAAGSAYGVTVAHMPATLAQEQALSDGTFALYDPNESVFDTGGRKTTLGQVVSSLKQGEGVSTPSALAPVTMAALSGEWWHSRAPGKGEPGTTFSLLEGISASGGLIDVGPADPTARQGFGDWQSHTGFAKGYMVVQPHRVVNAQGQDLTDAAYFADYKPYMSWGERWGADLQLAGTVAAGVVTMIAAPESAPLWLAVLSDAADGYFALNAAVGTVNAVKTLSTVQGRNDWANWLGLAANLSGGAASGFGALARTATIGDRLAAGSSTYADVARVTGVARGMDAQQFADAQVRAALAGTRLTRTFGNTLPARWLARPALATEGTMQGTAAFAELTQAWQGSPMLKLLGRAAMVTNGTAMAQQAAVLAWAALEGKPVAAGSWLNLASSAGLTGLGFGMARAGSVDAIDAQWPSPDRPADSSITASPGVVIPPKRSYTIPASTQQNPDDLATVISHVLGSQGDIDGATYFVFAPDRYQPADSGFTPPLASQDAATGAGKLESTPSLFDARRMIGTPSDGIAIVDSRGIGQDGNVPPTAVIATIRPGYPRDPFQIDVNPGYTQPIRFSYPHRGRAGTHPPIGIDEATGGWLMPDEVRQNGGLMDDFIAALASSGGRLAGTRYVFAGAQGNVDGTNPAVAIVDEGGQTVATLHFNAAANGWQADFVRDYDGRVSVAYPAGFDAGQPLIRSRNGKPIDAINAQAGNGRTQLASYPRREGDLAVYINFGDYPEKRLLGVDASGKPLALLLPAPPGYFIVNQHAGPKGFLNFREEVLTPEDEAALIIGAGWDGKMPILFYSCGPGAQFDSGDGREMEAPVIQRVTDALQSLYPLMRGGQVDAGFHTIAANRPVAWYVADDQARVGGYTSDIRVPSMQEWAGHRELSDWIEQQGSIAADEAPSFSYYYPGAAAPNGG